MRISCHRWSVLLASILLVVFQTSATKLRGIRARGRRLNQDGLLFTEGRKGGDRKDYHHHDDNEEDWFDTQDSREIEPAGPASPDQPGNKQQQKGESFYDRPHMKFSKEAQRDSKMKSVATKASRDDPGMKGYDDPPMIKDKSATEAPYDSLEGDVPRERPDDYYDYEDTPAPKGPYKEPKPDNDYGYEEPEDFNPPPEPGKYGPGKDSDYDGASEDGEADYYFETDAPTPGALPDIKQYEDFSSSSNLNQVEFVLSQFGLEFQLSGVTTTKIPQTTDFAQIEKATIGYVEEFLELTYSADPLIFFDSVKIEATSRRTGGTSMTPFIDFEASVAFANNSPMTPTNEEIGLTIAEAFAGKDLSTYLFSLASHLEGTNPFLSTDLVTVYVPDAAPDTGRVAQHRSGPSAAGIVAATSTGVLTLLVGGFLLFKIRKENEDMMRGGKYGKGYAGGSTLAGDTYDNSTLEEAPSSSIPNDDGRSLVSMYQYNDDRSILSSLPPELAEELDQALEVLEVLDKVESKSDTDSATDSASVPFDCSSTPKPVADPPEERHVKAKEHKRVDVEEDYDEETIEDFNDEEEGNDDEIEDSPRPASLGAAYASLVGRTKAMVTSVKQPAAQLSNVDIKNYFKSKYNCKSPQGYEAVDKSTSAESDGVTLCDDTRIHDSRDLVLPALDHDTGPGTRKAATNIPGNGPAMNRLDSEDDSTQHSQPGQVFRVAENVTREVSDSRDAYANAVPRLPSEVHGGYSRSNNRRGEAGSVGKSFDDVSLDTMTTLTEL